MNELENKDKLSLQIKPGDLFFSSFELLESVGKGCFGSIFRIRNTKTGRVFALKKVLLDSGYQNRELAILKSLSGQPHLLQLEHYLVVPVKTLASFFKDAGRELGKLEQQEADSLQFLNAKYEEVLYILSKCYETDLRSFVTKTKFELKSAKIIARSLAIGLNGLHSLGICHRDLKSENILLDASDNAVAIGDFGSAKSFGNGGGGVSYICSRPYRAPELLLGHTNYGLEIDLWSLGCIFYEIFSIKGDRLFKGKNNKDMLLGIIGLLGPPSESDLEEIGEKRKIDVVSKVESRELKALLHPDCDEASISAVVALLRWSPKRRGPLTEIIKLLS